MPRFRKRRRPSCLLQAVRQRCLRPLRKGAKDTKADHYVKSYFSAEFALALIAHFLCGTRSLRSLQARLCQDRDFGRLTGLAGISKAQLPKLLHARPSELWLPLLRDLIAQLPGRKLPRELRIADTTFFSLGVQLLSRQMGAEVQPGAAGAKLGLLLQPATQAPLATEVRLGGGSDTLFWPGLLATDPPARGKWYLFDRGFRDYGVYDELISAQADFLTRAWDNQMHAEVLEDLPLAAEAPEILSDQRVVLGCHSRYRMKHSVRYFVLATDEGQIGFLTSDFKRPAKDLADMYRCRWQVEVFFRWLKSTVGCTAPLGYSATAAEHTIYAALVAYLLLLLLAQPTVRISAKGRLRGLTAVMEWIRYSLLRPCNEDILRCLGFT